MRPLSLNLDCFSTSFLFLQLLMAFPLLWFLSLNDKLGFGFVFVLDFL